MFTENLAFNKSTYMQTTYFNHSGETTFDASNAVDGRKTDLSAGGGQCAISANSQRSATWRVNLGSIQSIHHITIYFRTDNKPWGIVYYWNKPLFLYINTRLEITNVPLHALEDSNNTGHVI